MNDRERAARLLAADHGGYHKASVVPEYYEGLVIDLAAEFAAVRAEERERIKQWLDAHGAEIPGWGFMQDMVDDAARARGKE